MQVGIDHISLLRRGVDHGAAAIGAVQDIAARAHLDFAQGDGLREEDVGQVDPIDVEGINDRILARVLAGDEHGAVEHVEVCNAQRIDIDRAGQGGARVPVDFHAARDQPYAVAICEPDLVDLERAEHRAVQPVDRDLLAGKLQRLHALLDIGAPASARQPDIAADDEERGEQQQDEQRDQDAFRPWITAGVSHQNACPMEM